MKTIAFLLFTALGASSLTLSPGGEPAPAIPNPRIDYPGFLDLARAVDPIRAQRRLTEKEFAAAMGDADTVLLDARSADKYQQRHVAGAVSLPFTDFTAAALAAVIPAETTRVLIYCNNNFIGDDSAFAEKSASASLNISTYIGLVTYGYTNVWELGPLLDLKTSKLGFAGTRVPAVSGPRQSDARALLR